MNRSRTSYMEALQKLADEYFTASGQKTATTKEIAFWAIQNHRWDAPPDLILARCREDFARALREQYIADDDGNPVRAKHVARVKEGDEQFHLWADIRNAPKAHMELAFQQRREQIVGDCVQLKRDVDFYNSVNAGDEIQLLLDFTDDVAEATAKQAAA